MIKKLTLLVFIICHGILYGQNITNFVVNQSFSPGQLVSIYPNVVTTYTTNSTMYVNYPGAEENFMDATIGGKYSINSNIIVTAISLYNFSGNSQLHHGGIWDGSGNLLGTGDLNLTGLTTGNQIVLLTSPFVATNGQTLVVGWTYLSGGDYWMENDGVTTFGPSTTALFSEWNAGSSLTYPSTQTTPSTVYAGAGFSFISLTPPPPPQFVTNFTLSNLEWTNVNAGVSMCLPGSTIHLPAGRTTNYQSWPNISGIQIIGAGTNLTIVCDETPLNDTPIVTLTCLPDSSNALTRLSGIFFEHGTLNNNYGYPSTGFEKYSGNVQVNGTGHFLRIDNCAFEYLGGKPIQFLNQVDGVVDHCFFSMYHAANCMECFGAGEDGTDSYGDYAWSVPYTVGTSNNLFLENNTFKTLEVSSVDAYRGSHVTIRSNMWLHTFFFTHGTDSGGRFRGHRASEVYWNTFVYSTDATTGTYPITIDSGESYIWGNMFTNWNYLCNITYVRAYDNSPSYVPFHGMTGINGYDSNSPIVLNVIATTTSGTLTVAGSPWVVNAFIGCSLYNSNTTKSSIVLANTANTMTVAGDSTGDGNVLTFNVGDAIVGHFSLGLDKPGNGYGTRLTGDTPTATWCSEIISPVTFFGNNTEVGGGAASPISAFSSLPNIVEAQDFTNSVSNFSAENIYTYPHPLVK